MRPSILIAVCDSYLAGIYGRKFERSGWDVVVSETLEDAERRLGKMQPSILLIETDCNVDVAEDIRRLRKMPTLQRTKIVVLAPTGDRERIISAKEAGASAYLLAGHFVPQEAVTKMKRLISNEKTL